MKHLMPLFGLIFITSSILPGCDGSSIESDAKKVAELQCKAQKIMEKASAGDLSAIGESNQLVSESEALLKEMEEKYPNESDREKLAVAVSKEMGNCK